MPIKMLRDFIKETDVQNHDVFVSPDGETWLVVKSGSSIRLRKHGRHTDGYYECEDLAMSEHLDHIPSRGWTFIPAWDRKGAPSLRHCG